MHTYTRNDESEFGGVPTSTCHTPTCTRPTTATSTGEHLNDIFGLVVYHIGLWNDTYGAIRKPRGSQSIAAKI